MYYDMFRVIAAVASVAAGSLFVTVFGITGITLPIVAAGQTAVNPVSVSVLPQSRIRLHLSIHHSAIERDEHLRFCDIPWHTEPQ
jgi:hypothetical protein